MIDFLFIISYFTIPIIVIKIMHGLNLRLFTISLPSFVMISMFVFAYIGLMPLYFEWNEYRVQTGVDDKFLVFQVFVYSVTSIFCLLGGFAYAKYILKLNTYSSSLVMRTLYKKEFFLLILFLCFCFIVLFLYLSKVPQIALFSLFDGGILDAKIARSNMGNNFDGKYYRYSLIMHDLLNIITYILFSNWLLKRNKLVLLLFAIAFVGSSFTALMAIEKAPFAWLLIGIFLTYYLTLLGGKIPIKGMVKLLVVLFSVLITLYLYLHGSSDVLSALGSVVGRALTGGIQPAYHYLEYFPTHGDFLFGTSMPNPGGIMPYEPAGLTKLIYSWKFPEKAEVGIVGSMPTVFWGEAYANFSFYGVVIISFLVGIIIWTVEYFVNKLENTPIKIGIFVWLLLHYHAVGVTGFSKFIFDFALIGILGVAFLMIMLANNLKIKYYRVKKESF